MICLLVENNKKFDQINNQMYISDVNLPIYSIMYIFFLINIIINIITNYAHNILTIYVHIHNFIERHLPEDDPNIFNIG